MAFELYNIADNTTGEIVLQLGVDLDIDPNGVTNNTPTGTTAYLGDPTDKPDDWYYVAGVKTARPEFSTVGSWDTTTITADGVDAATFGTGLPNPTIISVVVPVFSGIQPVTPFEETSGSFSITTPARGEYRVSFTAFPYRPLTTTLTAS